MFFQVGGSELALVCTREVLRGANILTTTENENLEGNARNTMDESLYEFLQNLGLSMDEFLGNFLE